MEIWHFGLIGGVVGGIAGGAAVLLLALFQKAVHCPHCNESLPRFRRPASCHQALWGGWTCPKCGCEISRKGLARKS